MSILLALLYPIAVQYERGGLWRVVMPTEGGPFTWNEETQAWVAV